MSWALVYRVALRALPSELRRTHGAAMEALFVRELARAARRGRFRRTLAGVTGVLDAVRRGVYERWRRHGAGPRGRRDGGGGRRSALDSFVTDVGHAVRSLRMAPGFTTLAVLTLALGLATTSASFAVVDGVLLRPLPFPDPERVVHMAWEGGGHLQANLSATKFDYWRARTRSFEAMATWQPFSARVETPTRTGAIRGLRVTSDFLAVVGHRPTVGRGFTPDEGLSGAPPVALVSEAVWRTGWGGEPARDDGSLLLEGTRYTVVGVLPETFAFPLEEEPIGVIVPLELRVEPADIAEDWPTLARLRSGVTGEEARAELASLLGPFRAAHPEQVDARAGGMTLVTYRALYVGDSARPLWILMGLVTVVLLIAVANVAHLFLARAERRRGEIAVRAALGASGSRIARLIATESTLVALGASAVALPLAGWVTRRLLALSPSALPRMESVAVDGRVVLFTFAIALLTGLVFGGAAARLAARRGLAEVVRASARSVAGTVRGRRGLLVAQSALSTLLLVGSGLFFATWTGLRGVDAGFDPRGLVAVRFPDAPRYGDGAEGSEPARRVEDRAAGSELARRVEDRAAGVAAIASIAGATSLPLERGVNVRISIGGGPEAQHTTVEWRAVTPGYFRTLGIGLRAGRAFEPSDAGGAPWVAIVNEAFARAHGSGEGPLGRRIDIGIPRGTANDTSYVRAAVEIVGVVSDIREASLRSEPRRTVYVPQAQAPTGLSTLLAPLPVFVARGRPGGEDLIPALRETLRTVDPGLTTPEVVPFARVVATSLARERFATALLSMLAAIAVLLTGTGVYGMMTHAVRTRRREIGVRMALGARGGEVTRLVVGQALAPVLLGLGLGAVCAAGAGRVAAAYLWGVTPTDPTTFATVAAILAGVAVVASWLPAREAAGSDPVDSLRTE